MKLCGFGDMEDKLLRTQILLRIFNKEVQEKLLGVDSSLDKIIQYCQAVELAEKSRKELEAGSPVVGNISNNQKYPFKKQVDKNYKYKTNRSKVCYKCNRNHDYGKW